MIRLLKIQSLFLLIQLGLSQAHFSLKSHYHKVSFNKKPISTSKQHETLFTHEGIDYTHAPVAFLHGINSNCQELEGYVDTVVEQMNHTIYTQCIEIGQGKFSTIFMDLNSQVQLACFGLKEDPVFSTQPFNLIGYSQGGLIARATVETCDGLKVRNLITFGGPHGGVSEAVKCADTDIPCKIWDLISKPFVYFDLIQELVAPAEYFRVFNEISEYIKKSVFLPRINNELKQKNQAYKDRLTALEHFRMFMWTDDMVVYPKQSAWFGVLNETGGIVNLQDQQQYQEDWLGLKTLGESNRTSFIEIPGNHMHQTDDIIQKYVVPLLIQ
ncbi:palmitoyl-protein thioesterase precursor [Stylonychia lemnae]|uniref:Palmitoyl-protein thioesterase n=1 Tax=Stylonychia lemnae TaxID=5949 RepID=A0A078AP17_STYLE|nr:palmitoyl-protein thioesterase precursor [Stylonychia lemnae]|eukprot:CDW84115.1 palmitoyl-protein thioesterase precursor [Stylonychia lemnae]